jgi:hypothetical protein
VAAEAGEVAGADITRLQIQNENHKKKPPENSAVLEDSERFIQLR